MRWVQSLKSSPGREALRSEMMGRWIDKSPKEALPFIQGMEPRKVKESVLSYYIRGNWGQAANLDRLQ